MTYLELVNAVLRRLREATVSTVAATSYSKLVGELVNSAKREVEGSWRWSALQQTIVVNTTPGTRAYTISGTNDRSRLVALLRGREKLRPVSAVVFEQLKSTTNSVPVRYCVRGSGSLGEVRFELDPAPDSAYALSAVCYVPQADLSADNTSLLVPSAPVIELAVVLAHDERGDTTLRSRYETSYRIALARAVATDALNQQELVWTRI